MVGFTPFRVAALLTVLTASSQQHSPFALAVTDTMPPNGTNGTTYLGRLLDAFDDVVSTHTVSHQLRTLLSPLLAPHQPPGNNDTIKIIHIDGQKNRTIATVLIASLFDDRYNDLSTTAPYVDPCDLTKYDLGFPYGHVADYGGFFQSSYVPACIPRTKNSCATIFNGPWQYLLDMITNDDLVAGSDSYILRTELFESFYDWANHQRETYQQSVYDYLMTALQSISDHIKTAVDSIRDALQYMYDHIKAALYSIRDALQYMYDNIEATLQSIYDALQSLSGNIKTSLQSLYDHVRDAQQQWWQRTIPYCSNAMHRIASVVKDACVAAVVHLWDAAVQLILSVASGVLYFKNGFVDAVVCLMEKIVKFASDGANIVVTVKDASVDAVVSVKDASVNAVVYVMDTIVLWSLTGVKAINLLMNGGIEMAVNIKVVAVKVVMTVVSVVFFAVVAVVVCTVQMLWVPILAVMILPIAAIDRVVYYYRTLEAPSTERTLEKSDVQAEIGVLFLLILMSAHLYWQICISKREDKESWERLLRYKEAELDERDRQEQQAKAMERDRQEQAAFDRRADTMAGIFQLYDEQCPIPGGIDGVVIPHILSIVHQMDEQFNADLSHRLRSLLDRYVDSSYATTLSHFPKMDAEDALKLVTQIANVKQEDEQMMRYGQFDAVANISDWGRAAKLMSQYRSLYEHKKKARPWFMYKVPPDYYKLRFLADWIEQHSEWHSQHGRTSVFPSLFEEVDVQNWP